MRIVLDVIVEAFVGLYHHWFRAMLSMLGISWGIVSVVVLLAYGSGFKDAFRSQYRAFENVLEIAAAPILAFIRRS